MTGTGFELLAVEPFPSTPSRPAPQAYTRPPESKSECVRAPVAAVTSLSGIRLGRSCARPDRQRSPLALRPHPQARPSESMARAPSNGIGFGRATILTPAGKLTCTARVT